MSEGGLRAVFLAERAMLGRLMAARLGNADEAEDALQELWLRLDRAGGPIAEPVGYLYRMAANLAADRRKSAIRREAREAAWGETREQVSDETERALLARERLAQVEAALAAMPERVAAAFRLYRYEDLPQKLVAARMGISVSRVEQLLQDAYRRLHRALGGDAARPRRLGEEEDHRDAH